MMRALRVAVLGEMYPGAEGMAVFARELMGGLRDAGVEVLDLSAGTTLDRTAVPGGWRAPIAVARFRPDVVHYIPRSGLTAAALARAAVCRAYAPRAVHTMTVLQADEQGPAVKSFGLPPNLVFTLCEGTASIVRRAGLTATCVYPGVDLGRFSPDGHAAEDLWDSDTEGPRVLHVGHLTRGRGLGVLGELSHSGCRVLMLASPHTSPDAGILESLAEAGVTVLREYVDDVAEVYRAADVYAFPVTATRAAIDVPLSVLEALACGTPVVSTRFAGLEAVTDAAKAAVAFVDNSSQFPDKVAVAVGCRSASRSWSRDWDQVALEYLAHWKRLSEQHHRTGLVIVLLGIDGAGKSTQAAELERRLEMTGLTASVVWSRWKPMLVGPVMRLGRRAVRRRARSAGAAGNGDDLKQGVGRRRWARNAWYAVAGFDHSLQAAPRLWLSLLRHDVTISDRYYYDTLVDMGESLGVDTPVGTFLRRAFPAPGKVFLLDIPAAIGAKRKPGEEDSDEQERKRRRYLALASAKEWEVVDATLPFEAVAAELLERVKGAM